MSAAAAPRATRREWIGLAIIALPCMVYAMDLTVLNLAIPALSAELNPSSSQLLWIIDIYGFMVAGFLITMGTLGDRFGRRRLLLIGATAFAAASLLATFSSSAAMLIATRALLGIAGATLAPSTMSLIRNMFHDERQRQFAIGVWIASFSIGGVIGPLVGGVIIEWYHWSSVFLVAVPVMGLLLLLGPVLLPEYRDPNAGSIDPYSVGLSLGAVLATIYGLKQFAEHGPSLVAVVSIVAGIALGVVFVRRQKRLAYPLMELALFRLPRFSAAIAAYALSSLAMFGVYIFITQYLQLVRELSPLHAGLATVPWSLAFVVGSLLSPRFAHRWPASAVLGGGLVAAALGLLLLALADSRWGLAVLILATIVMSLGLAPVFTLGNEMIITSAPPERAGAASALSETSAEFSAAMGVALFGSLGTVLYRAGVRDALPAGVPREAADQALATLGAAVSTAQSLPASAGNALAAAARASFVDALQAAAIVAAAILLATSVVAVRILRNGATAPVAH
jgi:DHA2 family multidrug resistance protein-like MFS transporter